MSALPGFRFLAARSPHFRTRTACEVHCVTASEARAALERDAVARRILAKGVQVLDRARVGSRLNLNVYKHTGVAVNTVHEGRKGDGYMHGRGWWNGTVLDYQPIVTLRNAYFNVNQAAREKIASGRGPKEPMASVDGEFVACNPCFDGIEIHSSPRREHLFRDLSGCAIRFAESATIVGNAVYAAGSVEYFGPDDAPARAGSSPTEARLFDPSEVMGSFSAMVSEAEQLELMI